MRNVFLSGIVLASLLLPDTALADDWVAAKLRGPVFQYVDDHWIRLERGMIVPDDRPIQTLGEGHVEFTRGQETIDVGPATQIRILDRGTASKPATTVNQYFGSVSIEAQVENVQHFTVQTPYLAAIVKGTRFTVSASKVGTSVSVERGHVAVEDRTDHTHVLLSVGQSADVDVRRSDAGIVVAGNGDLPAVVSSHVSLPNPSTNEVAPSAKHDSSSGGKANEGHDNGSDKTPGDGKGSSGNDSSSNGKSSNGNSNSNNESSGNGNSGSNNLNSSSGNSGPGNGGGNGNGGSGNCNGKGKGNKSC